MESVYYDTNVFEHALNATYAFHSECRRLVEPELVTWKIVISEWVRAEFQNNVSFLQTCLTDRPATARKKL
ncbi:MAG: hypothetical protein AB1758_23560 [Candidatus Eremiobacterota bacterium]